MNIEITEQELNWLYYGDEYHQIIGKLTNEENRLKSTMSEIMSIGNNTLIDALAICVKNIYDKKYNKLFTQLLEEGQAERLKLLDQKYNLCEYYNNVLGIRR
jgi:predicted RNA-binding protein with EMAP domain